jgi:type IV secretion system protein VirB3
MDDYKPYPLFKGATRIPLFFGVPVMAGLFTFGFVAALAMLFSLWFWVLLPILWFSMRLVIKSDDRAFTIWSLWFETKFRNRNKKFWGASSYSPVRYGDQRDKATGFAAILSRVFKK